MREQKMPTIVFCCAVCQLPLTSELRRLEDLSLLVPEAGREYLPQGFFHVEDGTCFEMAVGQYLVNLKDMSHTKYHPDTRRLIGCCGPSGYNGRNVVCSKGHEVGTEIADCLTPHATALDPAAVTLETAEWASLFF